VFNDGEPLIEPVQHQNNLFQNKAITAFVSYDVLYTFQSVFKTSLPSELGSVSYEIHVIKTQYKEVSKIMIHLPKEFANSIPAEKLRLNVLKYEPASGKFVCTMLLKRPSTKEIVMMYVQSIPDEQISSNDSIQTKTFICGSIERQIVYPYLCRTTFHPAGNRIIITNMQVNCPSKVIKIKEGYRVVKFAQVPQDSVPSDPLKIRVVALVI